MKKYILYFLLIVSFAKGQGYNHQWLLGNNPFAGFPNGKAYFDSSSSSFVTEFRKISFEGTEANISDANGNLLMSSNGAWIANATGDTMLNGSGLNPSIFTGNWPYGFPIDFMNIIVNYPADTNKYVLFHQTPWEQLSPCKSGFYKSEIDISVDSVINKNDTLFADTLSAGIGACKHANGRDWWVFVMRDYNPIAYTFLLTPNGIDTMFTQNMGFIANTYGSISPIVFSQDGKKMITCTPVNQAPSGTVLLYDFDRCTGLFSNLHSFPVSPGAYLWGLAFSSSGKFAYTCTSNNVYQINVDSLTYNIVATYDGFISPPTQMCCPTTFWAMYLAANGKIYITSGSSVQHIHEMNYPDSAGIACGLQQHAIDLVNYLHNRAVPNHPNYYLGCDTTSGCPCLAPNGIEEPNKHNFIFKLFPNPNNGVFNISYLLPQNKTGKSEIFDITGKRVYSQTLPQWSTEQQIQLPNISEGLYNCVITSGNVRVSKKTA
ncbi:MAG: T9SS type A sorting domain-containing protein, partial [Bacteroidota bacterium]